MSDEELIRAGREMIALETLAEVAHTKDQICRIQARFGTFEEVEASYRATESEDPEVDDAYLDWRAARERLKFLEDRLSSLQSDDAA